MSLLSKLMTRDEAVAFARKRSQDHRLVFTNGCFDILHPGHVLYLDDAASRGDLLVVGLNTDRSVRRLKGHERPVQDEHARSIVLAGLASVDAIVLFDEDTPLDLILALRPDLLVKGGDYTPDDIVGAQEVCGWGGKVEVIPFSPGHSTTDIISHIRS